MKFDPNDLSSIVMRHFKKKEKRKCECPYCGRSEHEKIDLNKALVVLKSPIKIDIYKVLPDSQRDQISNLANSVINGENFSEEQKRAAHVPKKANILNGPMYLRKF